MKVIAYPTQNKKSGHFTMLNLYSGNTLPIDAHSHDIECLEMDYSGTVVASASKKGTIIRIFRTRDGTVL